MSNSFINIHTHRPELEKQGIVLINCFPNGTTTEYQYKENASFAEDALSPFKSLLQQYKSTEKKLVLSCGIHPWYIADKDHAKALGVIEQLCEEKLIHAIGEAGLSKRHDYQELSKHLFLKQLAIAEKYKLPFIIHCENEYNEMIKLFKDVKPKVPVIFHHFNSNIETAAQLIKYGYYLSFGAGLRDEQKRSTKAFKELPLESVFFETDDRHISVETVYETAAAIKNISPNELQEKIFNNFKTVFGEIV